MDKLLHFMISLAATLVLREDRLVQLVERRELFLVNEVELLSRIHKYVCTRNCQMQKTHLVDEEEEVPVARVQVC